MWKFTKETKKDTKKNEQLCPKNKKILFENSEYQKHEKVLLKRSATQIV